MDKLISWLRNHLFSPKDPTLKKLRYSIRNITNLRPINLELYKLALQHSSVKNSLHSNERLEFLGDAVLSLTIGAFLFKKYPHREEGFLTEIRSRIVNRNSLTELAKKIGIDSLLTYNTRSINHNHTKFIYGNALEALIGAIYIDLGYKACNTFIVNKLLQIYINLDTLLLVDDNHKSKIISWAQKNKKKITFKVTNEKNIAGEKEFIIQLLLDGEVFGEGSGKAKKQAEQWAAQKTLERLSITDEHIYAPS